MSEFQVASNADPGADASFYLANYRLGKTLGVGSFGKVIIIGSERHEKSHVINKSAWHRLSADASLYPLLRSKLQNIY